MPLTQVVMVLVVMGIILWMINTYIPLNGSIRTILNAVVVLIVVLYLLNVFGVLRSVSGLRIGR